MGGGFWICRDFATDRCLCPDDRRLWTGYCRPAVEHPLDAVIYWGDEMGLRSDHVAGRSDGLGHTRL
jgi:hypothetical protein